MTKDVSLSPVPVSSLTVKICGETPVLTKCDISRVPEYDKFKALDYFLLDHIKQQMYTFKIAGINVYIEEGCTFIINERPARDSEGSILIIGNSVLEVGTFRFCTGVSILSGRTNITVTDGVSIGSSLIRDGGVVSEQLRLFRTTITNGWISTGDVFESFDSSLNNTTLTGFNGINITRGSYSGNEEFALMANEYAKHKLTITGINLPSHSQDFSCNEDGLDVRIQHRVDIGTFSGVRTIPFVRANRADLVAGDVTFPESDFWQEETEPDIGSIYVQQLEKNHPQVIKTRAMINELKYRGGFDCPTQPLRRSTDTEHMLVKSILVGIVSRINIFKTLDVLR